MAPTAASTCSTATCKSGDLDDSLGYDAVRARLIESGEAVKRIPAEVVATEPGTPWRDIGTMRDRLAHRYFDTLHSIVQSTVENDLRPLEQAVLRLPVAAGSDEASCLLGRLWARDSSATGGIDRATPGAAGKFIAAGQEAGRTYAGHIPLQRRRYFRVMIPCIVLVLFGFFVPAPLTSPADQPRCGPSYRTPGSGAAISGGGTVDSRKISRFSRACAGCDRQRQAAWSW